MEIILIPGFWLDGSSWDLVAPVLEQAGHHAHSLTLPGMEARNADRSRITLRDHVDAVIEVIDSIDSTDGKIVLVGHSGGGAVAHAALDARYAHIAHVVYVDCVPLGEGAAINDQLPTDKGEIPLPDWSFFDREDLIDLNEELRFGFRERAIPTPAHVASDPQRLFDERRYTVPVTVIACEFTGAQLKEWMQHGYAPELTKIHDVDYTDLPTGHWPQFTRPTDLGRSILASIDRA